MSCRFPGADNVEQFWRNLRDGVESITLLTEEEIAASGVPATAYQAPTHVKAASVLTGVELFDAEFFGIASREAELMDPQQRLFLECAWEALESAGYDPQRFPGRIGVYAGASLNSYALTYIYNDLELMRLADPLQMVVAIEKDFLATLISYKLDLKGPSLGVQTACSTALVAVHLACQSLSTYQCDMALAGGVCVKVPQQTGYQYIEGGVVARDGHCRAFDAKASGTIFGSGLGIVVLKRLEDALADGDSIDAVIRGSAINNDGAVKVSFTAPSVRGQAEVIAMAHALADVPSDSVTYVETHGTGTPLGDPIEIAALREAFAAQTHERGFCAIGSVKSNIGHLDAAAGIAGLIKTALALKHRLIPPSLHFERPNPQIDFEGSPFFVNTRLRDWQADRGPRRAGVSSFGIGGTNAHLVLEEAPPTLPSSDHVRAWQLLPLSARSSEALQMMIARLGRHLELRPAADFADVAYTLQVGRRRFDHRLILVCRNRAEAIAALTGPDRQRCLAELRPPCERPVAFLFPGQGAQYVGMGRGLYESEAVYRREVDRCAELLLPHLGRDLRPLLYPSGAEEREGLNPTALAQPALFIVEYALSRLWMEWGIRPAALLGHSVGEYVAACLAGTLELEDALTLVAERGRLMQQLPRGAMLSVPVAPERLAPWLDENLSLAAINTPSLCVVSGPIEAIEDLRRRLAETGLEGRLLPTSHAFHSAMVEPILEPFAAEVAKVRLRPPEIPFLSNVTGTWITAAEATDPRYWVRHLRQTVRFVEGLGELLAEPERVLLEVGPGRTLGSFVHGHPRRTEGQTVLASLRRPQDEQSDEAFLLTALGRLWLTGAEVDWAAFHAGQRGRRMALPTYPFERQRFWLDRPVPATNPGKRRRPDRQQADPAEWFYLPIWKQSMAPRAADLALSGGWLLLGDGAGMGEALSGELRARGHRVTTVTAGPSFARLGEDSYVINFLQREDYGTLIRSLVASGEGVPERIVHLWCLTGEAAERAAPSLFSGFYSLLYLAQALGETVTITPLALDVVVDGLWRVVPEDHPSPPKATLLGPALVIPQEYPNLRCRVIDVTAAGQESTWVATLLLAELSLGGAENRVAYRGYQRWIQTLEPVRLEGGESQPTGLRERGVYLITGGLGGIGLALGGYLAKRVQARLVLVGRREMPGREVWDEWLAAQGEQNPVSRRIRQVQALEALGAEVLVVAADVADARQARDLVRKTLSHFGALHGIIHGAGVAGGGAIQFKTARVAEAVMAPKVHGTLALSAAVADLSLDFMVLLSSTIALAGGGGQVDYCAANAFLDAFAHARAGGPGPRILAIDWDAWSEVGMAVDARGNEASENDLPAGEDAGHPLLGRRIVAAALDEEVYAVFLGPTGHWTLGEHTILGQPVLPGTAFLEMARAAAQHYGMGGSIELRDVVFLLPLRVGLGDFREVQTVLRTNEDVSFEIRSRSRQGEWQLHATGQIEPVAGTPARHDISGFTAALALAADADLGRDGAVSWGPHWREIVCRRLDAGVASLELPATWSAELAVLPLHPSLLDLATSLGVTGLGGGSYLPLAYKSLKMFSPLAPRIYVRWERRETTAHLGETVSFDVVIMDPGGCELVAIEDFVLRRVDPAKVRVAREDHLTPAAAAPESGIPTAAGVEAFARVLDRITFPQVVVTPRELELGSPPLTTQPKAAAPRHQRRSSQTLYVAPRNEIENAIVDLWAEVLGYEPVGIHDDFFAQGGHSVLAIQLLTRLRQTFEVEIPLTALFDATTVAHLADLVLRSFTEEAGSAELSRALSEVEAPAAKPPMTSDRIPSEVDRDV